MSPSPSGSSLVYDIDNNIILGIAPAYYSDMDGVIETNLDSVSSGVRLYLNRYDDYNLVEYSSETDSGADNGKGTKSSPENENWTQLFPVLNYQSNITVSNNSISGTVYGYRKELILKPFDLVNITNLER